MLPSAVSTVAMSPSKKEVKLDMHNFEGKQYIILSVIKCLHGETIGY